MKALAVIVPIYNMEKYIADCLESILSQTLQNIEIICINDGSQDDSLSILETYRKKDNRIIIINQENKGVSVARNRGIACANAEFVCFMDPDDCYPDNFVLNDLYMGAKDNSAKICGGSFSRYDERTDEIITSFNGFYEKYTFHQNSMILYRDYQYDYGYHRFIYSLKMLRDCKIDFPPYKRFQDPPFFVRTMLASGEFYALKRVAYRYRVGHQKINWNEEKTLDFLKGVCDNLKLSSENNMENLHAVTVQRLIEQRKAIQKNKINSSSLEYQKYIFNAIISIRIDLIEKSSYDVKLEQLSDVFHNSLESELELTDKINTLSCQYESIKNSNTFKVGKLVLALPKRIYYLFK